MIRTLRDHVKITLQKKNPQISGVKSEFSSFTKYKSFGTCVFVIMVNLLIPH